MWYYRKDTRYYRKGLRYYRSTVRYYPRAAETRRGPVAYSNERYYRTAGFNWAGKARTSKITSVATSAEFRSVRKSGTVLPFPGSRTTA